MRRRERSKSAKEARNGTADQIYDGWRTVGFPNDFPPIVRLVLFGWALREYSKTDEAAVRRFVSETALSPLSIREALKYVDRRKPQ
nr:DNA alkylation repair protein [Paenibacillus tianmuensis]